MDLILDKQAIQVAVTRRGYRGLSEIAETLNLHRNTLSHYINGKSLLPGPVQRLLRTLQLDRSIAFTVRTVGVPLGHSLSLIAPVVGTLSSEFPNEAFILFGSRARSDARKYSDFDIGILAHKPLSLSKLSAVREVVENANEDRPYTIDLIDLARADPTFIDNVRRDGVFLSGNVALWGDFLERKNEN